MPDYSQLKKIKIGDLLIKKGLLTKEQLDQALKKQHEVGGKIGHLLVKMGFVNENEMLRSLADQLKIPFIDLPSWRIKPDIIKKIPERIARRFRIILLDEIEKYFFLGMADPTDVVAYDEISRLLNKPVNIAAISETDLLNILDQAYHKSGEIDTLAQALKDELSTGKDDENRLQAVADTAPVAKMLDSIFKDAVHAGASDIHIEPAENFIRIRNRIDGMLQENIIQGKEIISALVLRIKLISDLDISERRLPQDGRFFIKVGNRDIDVRVSTMPVRYGESVVMRLLNQSKGILKLDELGMDAELIRRIRFLISRPNGMFLVTGPTGSGKTTTLYAALTELNTVDKKVITIEDPVEYTLDRANQVQINETIDLTFANVLRATLRQDPDIVMVGEMRDEETARIGIRAALTGHLVFSTLHTNDAISTAMRLLDMGVEGYLVASSLRAIVAQRLIRKICENCKENYNPSEQEQEWLNLLLNKTPKEYKFFKGKGCPRCHNTGYKGRIGVYELLELNHVLANFLRENDTAGFEVAARKAPGLVLLAESAFEYAIKGITSIEEVLRISGEVMNTKNYQSIEA